MIRMARKAKEKSPTLIDKAEACFGGSMDDDLNISIALASLFDFVREINNLLDANMVSKAGSGRRWWVNDAVRCSFRRYWQGGS